MVPKLPASPASAGLTSRGLGLPGGHGLVFAAFPMSDERWSGRPRERRVQRGPHVQGSQVQEEMCTLRILPAEPSLPGPARRTTPTPTQRAASPEARWAGQSAGSHSSLSSGSGLKNVLGLCARGSASGTLTALFWSLQHTKAFPTSRPLGSYLCPRCCSLGLPTSHSLLMNAHPPSSFRFQLQRHPLKKAFPQPPYGREVILHTPTYPSHAPSWPFICCLQTCVTISNKFHLLCVLVQT